MSAMFILVLASLFVAVGFLIAFLWAVRSGQYEDKYTPSIRMLTDDREKVRKKINDEESRES